MLDNIKTFWKEDSGKILISKNGGYKRDQVIGKKNWISLPFIPKKIKGWKFSVDSLEMMESFLTTTKKFKKSF